MSAIYGVVDLFAGPGGLGEGFASIETDGKHPFQIAISVEKETSAHRTLCLRAFIREVTRKTGRLPQEYIDFHAGRCHEPVWSEIDTAAWEIASTEARCLELGDSHAADILDLEIDRLHSGGSADTVLIGGPPCQAYSLVGRARSRSVKGYRPEEDPRHFLFREYLRVLDRLRPAAFVLENVKGLLSSKVEDQLIFDEIMSDITTLGGSDEEVYELFALKMDNGTLSFAKPVARSDFIVRAENHGIPQRRHRVIVIGIRSDLAPRAEAARGSVDASFATVEDTIGSLPRLRSGLSKTLDGTSEWKSAVLAAAGQLLRLHDNDEKMARGFQDAIDEIAKWQAPERKQKELPARYATSNRSLMQWLENDQLEALAQHETRGHMEPDLRRYLFAAVFGRVYGKCAKKADYPAALAPSHESWEKNIFSDRFRVQLKDEAATTITSHISKDGHYFIHPDPSQCRSFTVREAARLQTFPDDYLFLGNRTQQYVQVGNAVPPYLARQIAGLLLDLLERSRDGATTSPQTREDIICT